jgi:hypothetical protein
MLYGNQFIAYISEIWAYSRIQSAKSMVIRVSVVRAAFVQLMSVVRVL